MSRFLTSLGALSVLAVVTSAGVLAQDHQHPSGGKLGTVHFQTSCNAPAQTEFDRAMTLLHSFELGPAIDGFNAAVKADGTCAIAYWGIALARWSNPFAATIRQPAQIQLGLEAIRNGERIGAKTEREREYLAAAAKLYVDADKLDQRTRVVAYERAMAGIAAKYPDDREASIFWALSLTASALPTDKTYANQLKAGAILEKLYPEQPNHPGITHYIIHSYDYPALADRAIAAAHRYAAIAPAAAHALHMPSHTFTRVGAWQESVDSNIASAAAARQYNAKAEELHAMDYMTYAYLQTGQDRAVQTLMSGLPAIAAGYDPNAVVGAAPGSAGLFALAAIPARWVLERRDWTAAAALPAPTRGQVPYADAITHFTRALGATHTGRLDQARESIAALGEIRDRLARANENYWSEQVAIQHDEATAFLLLAEQKPGEALAAMRAAAVREDATEKNAVTPGPIAPARELLAEMLLELKQPAAALTEFQATLKKEPNRFRAVYGAAHAAELAGDRTTARTYYAELLTLCASADQPGRPELVAAKQAVARAPAVLAQGQTAAREAPRPIDAGHSLWSEELTWMEMRDLIKAGTTTIVIGTGGVEQNGPYVAGGKHNFVLQTVLPYIARAIPKSLIAPIVKFVPEGRIEPTPGGHMSYPGTISLEPATYEALLTDICRSYKAHGFTDIILLGDSGGNQGGLRNVAQALNTKWAADTARVHFLPEYYSEDQWSYDFLKTLGVTQINKTPGAQPDARTDTRNAMHDDIYYEAQIAVVSPGLIRAEERRKAGLLSLHGVDMTDLAKIIEIGRKLAEYRAGIVAKAFEASKAKLRTK